MSDPLLTTINLDDVLDRFSIFGRYHAVSAMCIFLAFIYGTITSDSYVFVAEDVQYRCTDIKDTRGFENESLKLSNVHDTIALCRVPETCTQWIYENPDSFVAEFQLACQDWKRTFVGSVHSFGYMVGLLVIGPLSDKFGRKPLAIWVGITGGVCGLVKSFITIYWIYIVLEFLGAAFGDAYSPLFMLCNSLFWGLVKSFITIYWIYIVLEFLGAAFGDAYSPLFMLCNNFVMISPSKQNTSLEMVPPKSRARYTTMCNLGLPTAGVIFPLIYWLISYWRTFLRVSNAARLLIVFSTFCLDESPRWLLTKGNVKAAAKIINKAAKMNKVVIKENLEMLTYKKDNSSNFTTAIAETFNSKALLKSFSACIIWWIASVFVCYGLSINSVSLYGNKYVNYGLSCAVDFPSCIITAYLMDRFNRKVPLICSFMACAVLCVGQPFIPNNLRWLSISVYMVGKLLSTMFFTITYIFTSELFPTYTRNSMHALCSSVGRIGGVAAPLTPLLMVYWTGWPTVLFGVVSLLGGIVTFIVPDTGEKSLPDTVLEAETLGGTGARTHSEEKKTSSLTSDYCSRL